MVTIKGLYSQLTNNTLKPLITNMNKPSVNKIAGNDSNTTSGFMIAFTTAKINPDTNATHTTLPDVLKLMCELNKPAAIQSPKLHTNQRTKKR
ncbi:MAG TPA: hypothetical protein VLF43_02910 [Candidatus Saccharimonadales bacterium]|nr:hypothetical protein [Candidatus Saccharimonadales bacterium]